MRLLVVLLLAVNGCAASVRTDPSEAALCGTDERGIWCARWMGAGFEAAAPWASADLFDAAGRASLVDGSYSAPQLDRDGRADACIRGDGQLTCLVRDGVAPRFRSPAVTPVPALGDLDFGDLDGDGAADLCAADGARVICRLGLGDGSFGEAFEVDASAVPEGTSTLLLGDLDGDRADDLCLASAGGVWCGSSVAGHPAALAQASGDFTDAGGWGRPGVRDTLMLTDLDGDARADMCGRTPEALICAHGEGARFAPASVWWRAPAGETPNDAAIASQRFADLDGDRRTDSCSIIDGSLTCALSTGSQLVSLPGLSGDDLVGPGGDDDGAASLSLIDLNADGAADACLRSGSKVRCALSTGNGFLPTVESAADLPLASGRAPLVEGRHLHPPARKPLNAVARENLRHGTAGWWISLAQQAKPHVVEGFTDELSYQPGDTVRVAISVEKRGDPVVWRLFRAGWYGGVGARQVASGSLVGQRQPLPPVATKNNPVRAAWSWSVAIPLEPALLSGIYVLRLDNQRAHQSYFTTFVVRQDQRSADLVAQRSDFTDAAYNNWDGQGNLSSWYIARTEWVSFDRPMQNPMSLGGYDLSAGFFAWEYPMVRFLERQGYDVKYVSQLDVHRSADSIARAKAFLSVGHDEYWSPAARDHVEQARDGGMHLAFFSADSVDSSIRFADPHSFTPDKMPRAVDPARPPHDNPSDTLTGTHYLGWCGQLRDLHCTRGPLGKFNSGGDFMLEPVAHPALRHLAPGTVKLPKVVGYEYEGPGGAALPFSAVVLARSPTVAFGGTAASMVAYKARSGARVFNAGSILWSHGLDGWTGRTAFRNDNWNGMPCHDRQLDDAQCFDHSSVAVQQITVSVLGDFGARPATPSSWLVVDQPAKQWP